LNDEKVHSTVALALNPWEDKRNSFLKRRRIETFFPFIEAAGPFLVQEMLKDQEMDTS